MTTAEKNARRFIKAYENNPSPVQLAKKFDVSRSTIYRWIDKYCSPQPLSFANPEYRELFYSGKRNKQTVEIFRATGLGIKSPFEEKIDAISKLTDKYSLTILCEALGVAKASYYRATREKPETSYDIKRRELLPIITKIFNESNQNLGATKIAVILQAKGYSVSKKLVADIMHKNGMFSLRAGSKKLYEQGQARKKNILQREFTTSRPNEVWVSDVTEFLFNNFKYYFCVVLDLYSRKVVAYHISLRNSTQLTNKAFNKAYKTRNPVEPLMIHTDRGSNFVSKSYNKNLKNCGVEHSYSAPHVPYDNSVCEAFFKTLKQEEIYRKDYTSEKRMYDSIEKYINYYNSKRPHIYLHYKTPDAFEKVNEKCPK